MIKIRYVSSLLLLLFSTLLVSPAYAGTQSAQTAWRLLDYIAVDYREAVADGRIVNPAEYAEMTEFAGTAKEHIDALPATGAKADLQQGASALRTAIAAHRAPEEVGTIARELAAALIKAYPVPLAPTAVPDFDRGRALYATHCASCHGMAGEGHGPASEGLDPPPIAFADKRRAGERSIFALYQVIEQGIDGTSMASFAELPPADRWALAFYTGAFAYPESAAAEGAALWQGDAALRARIDMEKLVGLTPVALGAQLGSGKADAVTAYLRRNPAAVVPQVAGLLTLSRARLTESVAAYAQGDRKGAANLALSAYLDGFEPVEPLLSARDSALMARIEGAMGALRADIAKGSPVAAVRARAETLDGMFAEAENVLSSSADSASASFFGAFTVLLREGLEALLIVVAMVVFLRKAERPDVLPYVHGGWIAALVAGIATWIAATWFITVSGASRELTEGFGSLFAAVVLLWVGIWMHGKSNAQAWQRYIHEKMGHALTRKSAWFLFGLSFIVVYREVFETILFYVAIWAQGNSNAVIAGAGAAIAVLAVIAWVMIRYSRTLPIGKFFAYSSALIAVLAVVLIGKGVSALQEAGYLPINPLLGFPRIEILGLYPTAEGIAAQIATALLLLLGFSYNVRVARKSARHAVTG